MVGVVPSEKVAVGENVVPVDMPKVRALNAGTSDTAAVAVATPEDTATDTTDPPVAPAVAVVAVVPDAVVVVPAAAEPEELVACRLWMWLGLMPWA